MKKEVSVEQLLRLSLARAEAEAARPPRAARLLELTRPWWETLPELFTSLVERVGGIQVAYGHAMAEPSQSRGGYPVPTVIFREGQEVETTVRVLYFNVRDRRLRLRLQLDAALGPARESFEATFISDDASQPLLSARATVSVDSEYRIDAELSEKLARDWESLKVIDKMPFRLILRTDNDGG